MPTQGRAFHPPSRHTWRPGFLLLICLIVTR